MNRKTHITLTLLLMLSGLLLSKKAIVKGGPSSLNLRSGPNRVRVRSGALRSNILIANL